MSNDMEYFPLSIFVGAFQSVVGVILAIALTLWVAAALAAICCLTQLFSWFLLWTAWYLPVAWLVSVLVGLVQGWGLLTYGAIAICLVLFMFSDTNRLHLLFAVFAIQFIETTRLLVMGGQADRVWPAVVVGILLLAGYPLGYLRLRKWTLEQYERMAERNRCPACDYDIRASKDFCPECGEPIHRGSSVNVFQEVDSDTQKPAD